MIKNCTATKLADITKEQQQNKLSLTSLSAFVSYSSASSAAAGSPSSSTISSLVSSSTLESKSTTATNDDVNDNNNDDEYKEKDTESKESNIDNEEEYSINNTPIQSIIIPRKNIYRRRSSMGCGTKNKNNSSADSTTCSN